LRPVIELCPVIEPVEITTLVSSAVCLRVGLDKLDQRSLTTDRTDC